MPRIDIKDCESCPFRRDEEAHGPCDSEYWVECSRTGETIDGWDAAPENTKWKWSKSNKRSKNKFPPSCPLIKRKK